MTYEQFLEKLRETPRDWFLSRGPYGGTLIRRRAYGKERPKECPVCSLHPTYTIEAMQAREDLGLSTEDTQRIVYAADYRLVSEAVEQVRRDLLSATGLTAVL